MERCCELVASAPPSPPPCENLERWWELHLAREGPTPIDRAVIHGFFADRPAWAFASGYHEALRSLLPALGDVPTALCATEEGGAHPRAIHSTLNARRDGWRLDGAKRFVTLGSAAERLVVFASTGTDDAGRNQLAAVCIPADREGVSLTEMPALPFVPEIPHATVQFEGVRVERGERLPGDGYSRYLKPFRTVEDVHVHGAMLGWLMQVGRRSGWAPSILSEMLALVAATQKIGEADPRQTWAHAALGGLLERARALMAQSEAMWERVDAPTREWWMRDRAILEVAGKARQRRLEVAWQTLGWIEAAEPL